MKTGIIGGTGRMGRIFSGVLSRAGYEVLVAGRRTKLKCTDIAQQCGLVMVSVPLNETVNVIEGIAPLMSEDQILCDLTSLKVKPVQAMLASKAQVIGLHPMFGPFGGSLRGQTIIICPARAGKKTVDMLMDIFQREGAKCTVTTPEIHDRMMAVVQGLTHFVTLCLAESVRRMEVDIRETAAFTSPVYQIELWLMGRLLSQDASLYADILQQNPAVGDVLSACTASARDLAEIVRKNDRDGFIRFFERNGAHLGEYCEQGQKFTDAVIRRMVDQ